MLQVNVLLENKSSKSYFSCRPILYNWLPLFFFTFYKVSKSRCREERPQLPPGRDGVLLTTRRVLGRASSVVNKSLTGSWHPSSDWPLVFPGWLRWTVAGVHTLYHFISKVNCLFSFVASIPMINNPTFQTSVFTWQLPEKQLSTSSPCHIFFVLFAPFGCNSVEDCSVLQVFIKWAGCGSISGSLCVDFTFSSWVCVFCFFF